MNLDLFFEVIGKITTLFGFIGSIIGFFKYKEKAINKNKNTLANKWTNEGDVNSLEYRFVSLDIKNLHGEVYGQIFLVGKDRPLECHIDVGYFSSKLHISELNKTTLIPIAEVVLKINADRSRIHWKLASKHSKEYLFPYESDLWPY